jgi:SRSO17 transposase
VGPDRDRVAYAISLPVGVGRQYTGTSGKVDNAHVAVYLTYATTAGHGRNGPRALPDQVERL